MTTKSSKLHCKWYMPWSLNFSSLKGRGGKHQIRKCLRRLKLHQLQNNNLKVPPPPFKFRIKSKVLGLPLKPWQSGFSRIQYDWSVYLVQESGSVSSKSSIKISSPTLWKLPYKQWILSTRKWGITNKMRKIVHLMLPNQYSSLTFTLDF